MASDLSQKSLFFPPNVQHNEASFKGLINDTKLQEQTSAFITAVKNLDTKISGLANLETKINGLSNASSSASSSLNTQISQNAAAIQALTQ